MQYKYLEFHFSEIIRECAPERIIIVTGMDRCVNGVTHQRI